MANKLTKKKLEELIMEVLNEKLKFDGSLDDSLPYKGKPNKDDINKNYKPNPQAFNNINHNKYKNYLDNIANNDKDPDDLSVGDIIKGTQKGNRNSKKIARNIAAGSVYKPAITKAKLYSAELDAANKLNITTTAEKEDATANSSKLQNPKAKKIVTDKITAFEKDLKNETDAVKNMAITSIADLKTAQTALGTLKYNESKAILKPIIQNYETTEAAKFSTIDDSNLSPAIDLLNQLSIATVKSSLKANIETKVQDDFETAKTSDKRKAKKIAEDPKKLPFLTDAQKDEAEKFALLPIEDPIDTPNTSQRLRTQRVDPTYQPFGQLNVTYTNVSPKGETFEGTKGDVKTIDLQLSEGTVETFKAIKGDNLIEKLSAVADFATAVDNGNLSAYKIGEITTNMRVLGFLADAAIEYEAASAGTVFETFLALAAQGYVIGGESGAADVIGLSGGKPVYYSAKFYASQNITQSDQAQIGFSAVMKQASEKDLKEGFIYIVGIKTVLPKSDFTSKVATWTGGNEVMPTDTKPNAIAIAAIRIQGSTTGSADIYAIQSDGTQKKITASLNEATAKVNLNSIMTEILNENYWLTYIPVFKGINMGVGKTAKNAAEYLSQKVTNIGNNALIALRDAYKNLKEIQEESTKYEANASKLTTGQEHNDYIQQVAIKYTEFKTNYNNALAGVGADQGLTGGTTGATARIAENKNKSLKDLDKLIERVILESMNKK